MTDAILNQIRSFRCAVSVFSVGDDVEIHAGSACMPGAVAVSSTTSQAGTAPARGGF